MNNLKNFQLVLGKTQEKALRESPPNCLVDPSLGTHLYVKINVSHIILRSQKYMISASRTASFIMWKMVQEKEPWFFAFMISQIFGMDGETN